MWIKERDKYMTSGFLYIVDPSFRDITYKYEHLIINHGTITVMPGFSCDGCSCAPDYKTAMSACIIHDALYKALREDKDCPYTRKQADKLFYKKMKTDKFKLARIYYWFVRRFGKNSGTYEEGK